MKLKKYSKYKDSWIDWIWKIPVDWNVRKIKNIWILSTSSVDKKIDPKERPIQLLNYMDIYSSKDKKITNDIDFMEVTIKPSQYVNSNLKVGDLLFTPSSETVDDIWHSAVVIEELKWVVYSYHILRLRFNNNESIDNDFKRYIFNNHYFLNQLSSKATWTTRMTLWLHDFKDSSFVLPPLQTQQNISSFLDSKTSQIEILIEKDRKIIELLKEKRVSLINKAVTKGLDDSVEMKDSWVEWIGKIPESWEVRRIKFSIRIKSWEALSNDEFDENWKYPVLWWNWEMTKSNKYNLNWEYLIIWRVWAYCWNIHKISWKNWITDNALIVNKIINYKINFLKEILISRWLNSLSISNAQPLITWTMIKEEYFPLPNLKEQQEIVSFLDKETSKVDNHIKKVEERIELYEEYKKSVIYNVVTGKVEV